MNGVYCLILAAGCLLAGPAAAQLQPPPPDLENRIPAPLPPPPQPPIINGPLQQGPPPGVAPTPNLNTFGDRVTRCLHQGSSYGLRGAKLDAYTRDCANAR